MQVYIYIYCYRFYCIKLGNHVVRPFHLSFSFSKIIQSSRPYRFRLC